MLVRFASQNWPLMVCISGPSKKNRKKTKKTCNFLHCFLSNFGNHFGAHFGIRSAKEGARWAQESHQEFKEPRSCIFKNLKKPPVFSVFGCRGFPRESQEARQGSQETPKETPKGVQNLVKKWLKSEPKNAQNKDNIYTKISLRPVVLVAVFEAMGPSKNAYFEDV